mmetsp:Transcript_7002/g.26951  ORF Transcript_7002/g.26951 Transcript_7002/m.26951 type:complete len:242 (-) Transcript_7002:489-1214(-)
MPRRLRKLVGVVFTSPQVAHHSSQPPHPRFDVRHLARQWPARHLGPAHLPSEEPQELQHLDGVGRQGSIALAGPLRKIEGLMNAAFQADARRVHPAKLLHDCLSRRQSRPQEPLQRPNVHPAWPEGLHERLRPAREGFRHLPHPPLRLALLMRPDSHVSGEPSVGTLLPPVLRPDADQVARWVPDHDKDAQLEVLKDLPQVVHAVLAHPEEVLAGHHDAPACLGRLGGQLADLRDGSRRAL